MTAFHWTGSIRHSGVRVFWAVMLFSVLCLVGADGCSTGGGGGNGNDTGQPGDLGNGNENGGEVNPPGSPEDAFEDYVPDPEVYAQEASSERIIEDRGEDGTVVRFPADQLVMLLLDEAPRAEAERLATEVGGEIVGQVPDIDLYQIELPTTTRGELDAALAHVQADPVVEAAGYNLENRFSQECPAVNDLEELEDDDRCAFAHTEYYQAITMFDEFRPHLTLHRVTVGVIDSGVQAMNGEFDDLTLLNLDHPGEPLTDRYFEEDGHGTQVTGVIGADDDGSGVNGIASRFLGDDLRVAVGVGRYVAGTIASTRHAIQAGARVVNLSFENPGGEYARRSWERLIGEHPEVLFVAAAGNDGVELTAFSAPGGIQLSNVITVGGTAQCDPQTLSVFSNHGGLVDIAGPAEGVMVVGKYDGHALQRVSGNSYAAPQVTALAAILFALDPQLTPQEVRETYILAHALPMDGDVHARMLFTGSIGQLLIDQSLGSPITDWLDPLGTGNYGSTGTVMSLICRGLSYTIDGYGTHEISGAENNVATGLIRSEEFLFTGSTDDTVFVVDAVAPFALGTYTVVRDAIPGRAYVRFSELPTLDTGQSTSGELTVETCRIDERNPFTNDPFIISASGSFGGVLEIGHLDPLGISENAFEGYFNLSFTVVNVPLGDPVLQYLEENCEGGIPAP